MKNIKKIAVFAGGAVGALAANPLTAMAATQTEEKRGFGETMLYALLNTVMGICIVFLVLLLIAWIISLFKYINKFEKEELSDDLELVAVITAAIHAYEEAQGNDVPADGLVIRSIRRANRAGWQNA